MEKVFLSFIIPAYNSKRYIDTCLKSILNQTCDDFEIVIINDGSSDNTLEVLENYQKKYNNIRIFSQENAGISAARNHGIEVASGEYITFVDHDDVIASDYVEKVKKKINQSKSDMLVFGYDTIDQNNKRINTIRVSEDLEWVRWGVCTVWLIVAKRELYMKYNIRFPQGLFNEDIPVAIKLSYYCENICALDEVLYHYRVYVGNTSSNIHKKFNQAPESRENVFKELRKVFDKVTGKRQKELIKYNAIKFYYGILFVYFKYNTKTELLEEYEKYTVAIKKYFPDYKKSKVYLRKPKGEPLLKRIAVWVSIKFDRIGCFKYLLLIINKKVFK